MRCIHACCVDVLSCNDPMCARALLQLRGGPGEGWSQRSLLFDIIRCSGMSGNRTLDPKTVTHLVVEDLDKPSEKLQAAHTCAEKPLLLS